MKEVLPNGKKHGDIPDEELAGLDSLLVSQEEMAAELKAMKEAVAEQEKVNDRSVNPKDEDLDLERQAFDIRHIADQARIDELREQLRLHTNAPKEQLEPISPEPIPQVGENDGKEPILFHETNVKYEKCRNCKGKGRVMLSILTCPKCGGSGEAPALKQKWSTKIVGYK